MKLDVTMEITVSLNQAFLIMYEFLEKEWELRGESKTDQLGEILGNLSLWETESGGKEPMDGAVFPQWIESAKSVLHSNPEYNDANVLLNAKKPIVKVKR